ncbi:MAG: hypothetical protein ACX936_00095 [Marinobacter sp.]
MFTIVDFLIALTFICVVMALVVWSRVKPEAKPDKQESEVRAQRAAAGFAQAGHWASSAVNVVIGVLLGVASNGLVQLMFTGAWAAVFNIAVLSAVLFFIVFLHDRLGKKLFPSGIRPAREPERARKTPLLRRLSLPAGLVLGVVIASLGLDDYLSDLLL